MAKSRPSRAGRTQRGSSGRPRSHRRPRVRDRPGAGSATLDGETTGASTVAALIGGCPTAQGGLPGVQPGPPGRYGPAPPQAPDALQVLPRRADEPDPRIGILDPIDRNFVDPQPVPLRQHQELSVKEPTVVLDHWDQQVGRRRAQRLETALGVGDAGAQGGPDNQVVGPGDDLALQAPCDPGPGSQTGSDGHVGVPGQQRGYQGQQGVEIGRQVDVHVGHHGGVAGAPRRAQGLAPARAGYPHGLHAVELVHSSAGPGARSRPCCRCRR